MDRLAYGTAQPSPATVAEFYFRPICAVNLGNLRLLPVGIIGVGSVESQ